MFQMKSLCDEFSLGKTKLSKAFKENTGKSPIEYYKELRLKEAKKLLREKLCR